MPESSPDGHSRAIDYVRMVLRPEGDLPASEGLSPSTEELSTLEESFFSQSLERLIASGGDRLLRELELVDDDSGVRFKIQLIILKLTPLATQGLEDISSEMKLEYDLLNWRTRAERAEAQNKELLETVLHYKKMLQEISGM